MLTRAENHSSWFPFTTLPEVIDASSAQNQRVQFYLFTTHEPQVTSPRSQLCGNIFDGRRSIHAVQKERASASACVCVWKVKWRHEQAHVQMCKTIVKHNCEMLLLVLVVCRVNYYIILFCSAPSARHTNRIATWHYMHVRLVPAMEQRRNSTSERQSN